MKHILTFLLLAALPLSAGETLALAGLSKANRSQIVDKLGKPESSYGIKNYPALMPGEYLEYPLSSTSGVLVRLHKDQMAQTSVTCSARHLVEVLKQLGFTAAPVAQPGGTPIMKLYLVVGPDGSRWEAKATLSSPGSPVMDLLNLKPL